MCIEPACRLHGADPFVHALQNLEASNSEGNTPLHWACLNGCQGVIKLLLANGASASALNR